VKPSPPNAKGVSPGLRLWLVCVLRVLTGASRGATAMARQAGRE